MKLIDDADTLEIHPTSDGDQYWLAIAKNGVQISNPSIDANELAKFIRELKLLYESMTEI